MKCIFFFLALLLTLSSFAQNEISFDFGYGLTGGEFKDFDISSGRNAMTLAGVNFTRSFPDSILSITGGLNIINRSVLSDNALYLHVPAGIEYLGGKRMLFVIGGGAYLNTLISFPGGFSDLNSLIFGGYGKIGTGFRINDKGRVMFTFRLNADISRTGWERFTSMAGKMSTSQEVYYTDKLLAVSLNYNL